MIDMTTIFIPELEDLHRMIRAFASVHEENVKDDIGPNKPDAPFFERLALADSISWLDAEEMAERFHKYKNTQLPQIQAIAGYAPDTDWNRALTILDNTGKTAKMQLAVMESQMNIVHSVSSQSSAVDAESFALDMLEYKGDHSVIHLLTDDEIKDMAINHFRRVNAQVHAQSHQTTIQCERFTRVWYGKNDYQRRWPKEVPSISIKLPVRDNFLYPTLKEQIGWPDFCYEGAPAYRMSIKDEASVIERALEAIGDKLITTHLRAMLTDAPIEGPQPTQNAEFTCRLFKDGVWIHIPFKEADIRAKAKSAGAKWQNPSKEWALPLRQVNVFMDMLPEHHALKGMMQSIPEVTSYLTGMAERVAISGASALSDEERVAEMQTRLAEAFNPELELFPFQLVGVRFAELSSGRCVIGDDMGLGKTLQAIAYAALHPEMFPVLIVCPAIVKYNWANEINKWLVDADVKVIKNGSDDIGECNFTVINYDLMSKKRNELLAREYGLVIFDESHYLKNPKAKRTQACMVIAGLADSVLCLTGTPITNRPKEFFTTLEMLRPSEWKGKKYEYERRYCDGHKNDWGYWVADGSSNEQELHQMTRDFMIRRLKEEVMHELPDKIRQTDVIVPHHTHMSEYVALRREWVETFERLRAQNKVPPGFILNMLSALRTKCGHIKIDRTVEWIEKYEAENDKPLVVFTHHLDVMEGVKKQLTDRRVETIHGGVSAQRRTEIVADFQANKYDVLICSISAANMGITLTAADTVLFVEREWVPAYEEQAEARIHRIGSTGDTVWAVYLTVEGTMDIKLNNVIEAKRGVISSIVDGGDTDQRHGVAKQLLQAMVDAGEVPASMMELFDKSPNPWAKAAAAKGAKKYE